MPWMVIRFTGFTCRGRTSKLDWDMALEWTEGLECGIVLCLRTIHVAGYGPTNKLNEHCV